MLYNESTGKPRVEADIFTLESFTAWLEKQPQDEYYNYCDPRRCCLAQYFAASGINEPTVFSHRVCEYQDHDTAVEFPHTLMMISIGTCNRKGWTFGAALARAKEAALA